MDSPWVLGRSADGRPCRLPAVVIRPALGHHRRVRNRRWSRFLPMIVIAALVTGCGVVQVRLDQAQAPTGDAATALAALPVKGRAPLTGYDRDQFGQSWRDIDRNGCDQRNDVLARDLTDVQYRQGTHNCVVQSGT